MNYALEIRELNIPCHLDIEKDIAERKNGLFTFTIRTNKGNIVDYNVTEYVNAKNKYLSLKRIVVEEFTIAYNPRERSEGDTVRTDNFYNGSCERNSYNPDLKHS